VLAKVDLVNQLTLSVAVAVSLPARRVAFFAYSEVQSSPVVMTVSQGGGAALHVVRWQRRLPVGWSRTDGRCRRRSSENRRGRRLVGAQEPCPRAHVRGGPETHRSCRDGRCSPRWSWEKRVSSSNCVSPFGMVRCRNCIDAHSRSARHFSQFPISFLSSAQTLCHFFRTCFKRRMLETAPILPSNTWERRTRVALSHSGPSKITVCAVRFRRFKL